MPSKNPHDSARIYSSQKRKHWYDVGSKIAQSEQREKSRAQWILLALMVVFAVIGGSFLGLFLQTQILNPPVQVVGICPAPAYIQGGDCIQRVCTTDNNGQETCVTKEAGYIVGGAG